MLNDIRYAVRLMARQRSFAATAILVLALGIGINSGLFAIVNGLLFQPLPAREPERLRFVFLTDPAVPNHVSGIRYPDFLDLRERRDLFSDMLARGLDQAQITAAGDVRHARGEMVSGNYFQVLGVAPALGRALEAHDDLAAAEPVVLISASLWRTRFNSDPGILGTTMEMDDRAYTIVGIMPEEFRGTLGPWEQTQYWVPLQQRAIDRSCRQPDMLTTSAFTLIARLQDGVSHTRAQAALSSIRLPFGSLPAGATPSHPLWTPTLHESGRSRLPFDTFARIVPEHFAAGLLALGTVVLLIAAANLGGLLAARGVTRQGEIATRIALGASRWRVARQLLCESLILALIGGALGLLVAEWAMAAFTASVPAQFARFDLSAAGPSQVLAISAPIDWRVVLYTLLVCVAAGLAVGLGPALRAHRAGALGPLTNTGVATAGRSRGRLQQWVVIPQICLSLGLLLVAGILVRALTSLELTRHGYDPAGLVSIGFDIPTPWRCRPGLQSSSAELRAYFDQRAEAHGRILARASMITGVARASLAEGLPLEAPRVGGTWITARAEHDGRRPTQYISRVAVTSDHFETMRMQILSGRQFDALEELNERRVVVLSQGLARMLFEERNPLGQQVAFQEASSPRSPTWHEVIGVVNDVSTPLDGGRSRGAAYVPLGGRDYARVLVARTTASPPQTLRALKMAIAQAAPGARIGDGSTVSASIDSLLYPRRLTTALLGVVAAIGLLLAGVGVYGVVSYSVAQRTREMGVRLALGAASSDIMWLVLREGARVGAIGGMLGVAFGYAAVQTTSSRVVALPSFDFVTLLMGPAVLGVAVLLACYVPARRASRTDPMVALRDL